MNNVIAMKKDETVNLEEKSQLILESIFPNGDAEEMFRIFLDKQKKKGKIYLPLCCSIAGLVNNPMDFAIQVEVRDDKTVIYF